MLFFYRFRNSNCFGFRRHAGVSVDYKFFGNAAFFLSGALFPIKNLPPVLFLITKMDPLSYGIDGLRGALIN
ncbi:MAG: ABC transporter permease [Patescibacteria group bacterium]|nr:ABC transporter permease [Patescibacteria group bacterium]